MAITLRHQTLAQFAARLREKYRNASKTDTARMAWWLIERISSGDITDAQVRSAFGMTTVQYTAFKAKIQDLHDKWASVNAAQGE